MTILALLAICSTAMAQQRDPQVEHAAVAVRYAEGSVHGFLELRAATGALLAHGDVLQVPRDQQIESRMVFHFTDGSVFEETVTFTQHAVFTMQMWANRELTAPELAAYEVVYMGAAGPPRAVDRVVGILSEEEVRVRLFAFRVRGEGT